MRLPIRSEEHTSELQSHDNLVCRLLLEKKKKINKCVDDGRVDSIGRVRRRVAPRTHQRIQPSPHTGSPPACASTLFVSCFFFFKDPATPEIYPLSLHDALPI